MTRAIEIVLTPRRSVLLEGHASTAEVLVRLRAPEAPDEMPKRPPMNLALVLDRSGSMNGAPLEEAVRAARAVVERMTAADRLALVSFAGEVTVDVPSRPAAELTAFLDALGRLRAGGNTALYDGWLAGANEAAPHVRPDGVTKVLLLSDGRANHGKTQPDLIAHDCARLADAGIHTTTFGLGRMFDEVLLGQMAASGRGRAYYGETAADLLDPFREELGLLDSLYARELRVRLDAPAGVELRVRNLYRRDADGLHRFPDLSYGGEVWAMVSLTIPAHHADPESPTRPLVLRVHAQYRGRDGSPSETGQAHLRLERVPAAAYAAVPEDPSVVRRAAEVRAAELQDEARQAAHRGDWPEVDRLLAQARAEAADNPWIHEVIGSLAALAARRDRERFDKATYYSSDRLRSRQTSRHESQDYDPERERSLPGHFRRKPREGKDHS